MYVQVCSPTSVPSPIANHSTSRRMPAATQFPLRTWFKSDTSQPRSSLNSSKCTPLSCCFPNNSASNLKQCHASSRTDSATTLSVPSEAPAFLSNATRCLHVNAASAPSQNWMTETAETIVVALSPLGCDGMFAARAFAPGEEILSEQPLASVQEPDDSPRTLGLYKAVLANGSGAPIAAARDLWRGDPGGQHAEAHALWAEATLESADERRSASDIMKAIDFNAYSATSSLDSSTVRYRVLYNTISKSNHSCDANAYVEPRVGEAGRIVCCRPIASGEEVLVSYLTNTRLLDPIWRRLEKLQECWEFDCKCARCLQPTDDTRQFSCAWPGCPGRCVAQSQRSLGHEDLVPVPDCAQPCNVCGAIPTATTWSRWIDAEHDCDDKLQDLPASLYGLWADLEEFSAKHPFHGLTGRWKNYIARHTAQEADRSDDPEEIEDLHAQAAQHFAAYDRCMLDILGFDSKGFGEACN